jgi:hypothetical protein
MKLLEKALMPRPMMRSTAFGFAAGQGPCQTDSRSPMDMTTLRGQARSGETLGKGENGRSSSAIFPDCKHDDVLAIPTCHVTYLRHMTNVRKSFSFLPWTPTS